jgi:Endodeoxyribonuclease RusA
MGKRTRRRGDYLLILQKPLIHARTWRRRALAVTGDLLPTSRPDVDNYIKAGLDSLNEIVVRDDSQIVEISGRVGAEHALAECPLSGRTGHAGIAGMM